MAEREPILWKGDLVGYIEEPTKYPALWRGGWTPAQNEAAQRFLGELQRGRMLWVEYGSQIPREMATVECAPANDEIELRLGLEDSDTLYTRV